MKEQTKIKVGRVPHLIAGIIFILFAIRNMLPIILNDYMTDVRFTTMLHTTLLATCGILLICKVRNVANSVVYFGLAFLYVYYGVVSINRYLYIYTYIDFEYQMILKLLNSLEYVTLALTYMMLSLFSLLLWAKIRVVRGLWYLPIATMVSSVVLAISSDIIAYVSTFNFSIDILFGNIVLYIIDFVEILAVVLVAVGYWKLSDAQKKMAEEKELASVE